MITDIDLLEQRCKNEYEEYINPFTDVMEAQAHINYEGAIQTSEIFELYAKTCMLLVPLETFIKHKELELKILSLKLKNSEEYNELKTIEAKDEQVLLDTASVKEVILELKDIRNHLRYVRDYLEYLLEEIVVL